MKRALASSILTIALLVTSSNALACVPIRYDGSAFTPQGAADQMVADAASIEIMRVTSRSPVSADPLYSDIYVGGPYSFRFESVRVLKGFGRGSFDLPGLGEDTRFRYLPDLEFSSHVPLWWAGERGYAELQETVLLDPANLDNMGCSGPLIFEVGANYLVFRGRDGNLLSPAFRAVGRPARPPQRPVIERLHGSDDPWLREVERAITSQGAGPAGFWDVVFGLVFGDRRSADHQR